MMDSMPWTSSQHLETGRAKAGPAAKASPARPHTPEAASITADPAVSRLRAAGKFLEDGSGKEFHLRAVIYGPFPPNAAGEPFPEPEVLRRDLAAVRDDLGANTLRVFHEPTPELLAACGETGLRLLVTFAWMQHADFLREPGTARNALDRFTALVGRLAGNPAIAGYLVGNEVPPDIVRWCGTRRVQRFLESLVRAGRRADPGALFSYANFPPTEYLAPRNLDFLCFNLYLHQPADLAAYLRRLHHLAGNIPVVIGEFGMDSAGEGEGAQADYYRQQVEVFRDLAIAGECAFSYTDEWFTGGRLIEGWSFGLCRRDRTRKPAWDALREAWNRPAAALPESPKVSVIVCAYNAAETLAACLESLRGVDYPDYEVLLIDDGSTDATARIAAGFPEVRSIRADHAGLSAARNLGAREATGAVLAYTDADCRAHPLWLHYAVACLREGGYAAAGGPNIPPPALNREQACVAAAPGGPREVMLDDARAEHLPGCNLVVWKSAFEQVGGFNPLFRTAGDDVDFCWRLTALGHGLGFHPGAMVWHERRRNVAAYFRQQRGYGEAEAWLWRIHQEAFSGWGAVKWQGRIYEPARPEALRAPRVYSGRFGEAPFQSVYTKLGPLLAPGTLEWMGLTALILVLGVLLYPILIPAAIFMFMMALMASQIAANDAHLESAYSDGKSRRLLGRLCLLQPLVRGFARWRQWIRVTSIPADFPTGRRSWSMDRDYAFWSENNVDKHALLAAVLRRLRDWGVPHHISDGWRPWDLELRSTPVYTMTVRTATEYHGEGRNLIRVKTQILSLGIFLWLGGSVTLMLLCLRFPNEKWLGLAALICMPLLLLYAFTGSPKLNAAIDRALRESAEELGLKPVKPPSE